MTKYIVSLLRRIAGRYKTKMKDYFLSWGNIYIPIGVVFILSGIALHFWAGWTLRNWWIKDKLCIGGPFRYFRHPIYAAWITFISFGVAFFLNSWAYIIWAALLHPIWHILVAKEEQMMTELFANDYNEYSEHVGRFVPRIRASK